MPDDPKTTGDDNSNPPTLQEKSPEIPSGKVLAGTDDLFDGVTHVGVAIEVSASGKVSHVMIPDATKINQGKPIYITAPVQLKGEFLKDYLEGKDVKMPPSLASLLGKLSIGCEAFYFSTEKEKLDTPEKVTAYNTANPSTGTPPKPTPKVLNNEIERGPLLMMFEVKVDGGLIGTLSGDEDLGKLFEINSVMIRVIRCPASKRSVLEKYVRDLSQG